MTTPTDRPSPHGLARPALSDSDRARLRAATPSRFQLHGEALRDATAVEAHLAFVDAILRNLPLPAQRRGGLQRLLEEVRARVEEPRLFLGVVGEFSAGKSTLINAWLRDDLLRRQILQGTTAAATLISHGAEPAVEARLANGERRTPARPDGLANARFPDPRERLRRFLHELSGNEAVARHVRQVNLQHPAAVLADGLVIVDTPGANATNPRHAEVTATALRELCDAAVIVVPATAPGSLSLYDFLRGHLGDVLHRCAFVVTMLDLVRPRERQEQLRVVRDRIAAELKLIDPCVLPAVPIAVLDLPEVGDRLTPEQRRQLTAELEQTEAALWRRLREQKLLIQMERVALLLTRLLEQLERTLREQADAYRDRHAALERNRIPDLRGFLDQARAQRGFVLRDRTRDLPARAAAQVTAIRKATLAAAHRLIDAATTRQELIEVLNQGVPAALTGVASELRRACQPLVDQVQQAAAAEYAAFETHFSGLYRSLATLGGTVALADGAVGLAEARLGELSGRLPDLGKPVQAAEEDQGNKLVGGAATGAVIGTMIAPGVGTVIGGVLGFLAGGLFSEWFGPSLDDLKATARADLDKGLQAGFADAERHVLDAVGKSIDLAEQEMARLIDRHGQQYAALVERMNERDRAEAAGLRSLEGQTQTALREIVARSGQLADARQRLRQL